MTVYAFSIENFNRPKYEVDGLMEMAKVKLEQLTRYGDILSRYGAAVRVLGQRSLIREDVLQVVDRAVEMTKANDRYVGSLSPSCCLRLLTGHVAGLPLTSVSHTRPAKR